MTDLTIWPARLVGDEYRCGRVVNGRQQCPGIIAWVDDWSDSKSARYEPGTVVHELPPWDDDLDGIANQTGILHLRNTTRERPRRRLPRMLRGSTYGIQWPVAEMPFTRKCPVCDCIARVDSAVLASG
jgi:hypothetical protein